MYFVYGGCCAFLHKERRRTPERRPVYKKKNLKNEIVFEEKVNDSTQFPLQYLSEMKIDNYDKKDELFSDQIK